MSLLRKIFGDSPPPPAPEAPPMPEPMPATRSGPAPGTQIHYHPALVHQLTDEHLVLLQAFGAIQSAAAQGNLAEAASLLEKFRVRLQGHLLTENVRLYIYLEHQLAGDPSSFALIHEFRQEMDGIGKALATFLRKYQNLAAEPGLAPAFVDELAGVGKVLVERIQREEATLYPLYTA